MITERPPSPSLREPLKLMRAAHGFVVVEISQLVDEFGELITAVGSDNDSIRRNGRRAARTAKFQLTETVGDTNLWALALISALPAGRPPQGHQPESPPAEISFP